VHDEAAFTATNSVILGQSGQPPPAPILVGLVEAAGGAPDVVAAVVTWGENHTVWDVYACRGGVLANVRGRKEMNDWYGSRGDRDPSPEQVTVSVHRLADVLAINAQDLTSRAPFQGFARTCAAKWSIKFADVTVELDEGSVSGGQVAAVAQHIRDRFVDAEPRVN